VDDVRQDQALLLRPTGPLDVESCGSLRHQLAAAFAAGVTRVVVDLRDTDLVDLTGLGVLAGAARYLAKQGGALVVTHASPAVLSTMRVNDLDALLEVSSSPPLRVVKGSGPDGTRPPARRLTVVPDEAVTLPG
jgi:anti-anti-sigma factor